jgi:hypothetical protein
MVRRHVIFGDCFVLTTEAYLDLKENIGRQFGVHPNEVLVVARVSWVSALLRISATGLSMMIPILTRDHIGTSV